jgi:pimeloyl-ACP methyl ester carboxylesterase
MTRNTYGLALAIVLSPTLLQTGEPSCSGDVTLSSLELEVSGSNLLAFSPSVRSYAVDTDAASAVLRAQSTDPSARVRFEWHADGVVVDSGELGVGGGEATTSIPLGEATLRVRVLPSGRGVGDYTIDVCRCATALYDRTDAARMSPFPDDYWLFDDPTQPTGRRVVLQVPPREPDVGVLYAALMNETISLDGFSPIGGIVIELSDAPDPTSLPLTPQASLDPGAALGLFNLTPGSDTFGERVPFQLTPVSRALPGQPENHSLVLFPSVSLESRGHYAVVLTKDARAVDQRPFYRSSFMKSVLSEAVGGEASEITRARDVLFDGVLDALSSAVSPPVALDSIALAVSVSIRSTDDIPLTPLSMKQQVASLPPPLFFINSVNAGPGDVAAIVRGVFQAPNYLEDQFFVARNAGGDPLITGNVFVPFVVALPQAAASGPVPVVMFQHGSPGSSEQVWWEAFYTLAAEGFAVAGMTDTLNRVLGQDLDAQNAALFQALLDNWRFPHFPLQTYAEQMTFLRLIEQLGDLDEVPYPGGDGTPDLDLAAPLTYVGLSMGSVHGSAFLAYAPEIKAAAIAAGALRQGEGYFGGGTFIDEFPPDLASFLPNANPADYWVGLSILQMVLDHWDPYNHSRHIYRDPVEVAGTTQKASILLQEGLRDFNHGTRALAWSLRMPHLEPVWEASPILPSTTGPVSANIDADTTAAFYQFVPAGVPGIPPTPGCEFEPVGHFCAQAAPEAQQQRALFLHSAINDPVPTVTDPLPP